MIAKMSKYDLILYAAQCDDFIGKLRDLGLVDITTTGWEPSDEDRQLLLSIEQHARAVEALERFRQSDRFAADAGAFDSGEEAFECYRAATQRATALGAEIARLEKTAAELRPWGDFSPEALRRLSEQGVVLRFFLTPRATYERGIAEWSARYTIEPIREGETNFYFVVVTRPGEEVLLDAQEVKLPDMDYRQAEAEIDKARRELAELDRDFSRAALSVDAIRKNRTALLERLQDIRVRATAQKAADDTLYIMEGWAEEATSGKVDALLAEYPDVIYLKSTPTPEDDTPVKLRNGWLADKFELVGDMYARPKYGTIDLTPFFAPFYMLFFGICLNDAGYGLVLLLLGLVLLHKNRRPGMMRSAAWFATMCASATILFGAFCGSFFGVSLNEWFPSVHFFDFQNRFFSIALAIGMVQILFGMSISVYVKARSFGFRYSLGTLGWLLVLLAGSVAGGLPMLNENWVIPGFTTSSVAFYVVLGIGAVLMFLFNSPGKNPLVNVGSGLWNFYNNLTGLLSDVLSYIRLFAIGLSGGVLALVFNSLADGFVPDGANILVRILIMLPILVIGHGINLFMSTISSFVHPMRLTFVEFYKNAGFEMASRSFDPIRKMN